MAVDANSSTGRALAAMRAELGEALESQKRTERAIATLQAGQMSMHRMLESLVASGAGRGERWMPISAASGGPGGPGGLGAAPLNGDDAVARRRTVNLEGGKKITYFSLK